MKKIFLLLVAMVAVSGMCLAQSGSCGTNLTWTYDSGTLTISGSGDMSECIVSSDQPWKNYKTEITTVVLPDGITGIGSYAFIGCINLATINLPNSIETIRMKAFLGCTSLTSVTIPSGVTNIFVSAFQNCLGLTSVDIPASVTQIGNNAFQNCTYLTDVTVNWTNLTGVTTAANAFSDVIVANINLHIPDGTRSIYESTSPWSGFNIVEMNPQGKCGDNLTWEFNPSTGTLTITGDGAMYDYLLTTAPWYDFHPTLTSIILPAGLTHIGNYAFYFLENISTITIPASVTSIGDYAFKNSGLASVTISSTSVGLGKEAFYENDNLTTVTISGSVTGIGDYAFAGCEKLTSINISSGTMSIGMYAFYRCTAMTSVSITGDVTDMGINAFDNCTNLATCTITGSLTSIGEVAFYFCSNLASFTIPASVTTIGMDAFCYCSALTNITLPSGLETIDQYAFNQCTALESVTIPASVTSIGSNAFNYCSALESISVESGNTVYDSRGGCNAIIKTSNHRLLTGCKNTVIPNTVTSIGNTAFSGCTGLTSIDIPSSITQIRTSAFKDCTGLKDVYVHWDSPISPASTAFDGVTTSNVKLHVPAGTYTTYAAANVWKNFNIIDPYGGKCGDNLFWAYDPSTRTLTISGTGDMYDYASSGAVPWDRYKSGSDPSKVIQTVVIGDGVTSIGVFAFWSCAELTNVTIGSAVHSINAAAFAYCPSLTSITIPDNVLYILQGAFQGCENLTSVTALGTTAPAISNDGIFQDCSSDLMITYPCGCRASYADKWSAYANQLISACTLTTIEEIYAAADGVTELYVDKDIQCNNWVVSGTYLASNYNAYVTDGEKGFSLDLGNPAAVSLAAGDKLNGLMIDARVMKLTQYQNAEVRLTIADVSQLTVTHDGVVTPVVKTIDQLSGINTGAPIKLKDLECTAISTDVATMSDGTNTINVAPRLFDDALTGLAVGEHYDITGIFQSWKSDNPHRIFPRSAADIVDANPHGQCGDNLFWEYDLTSHVLTITGSGAMYDYTDSSHAPWYSYKGEITSATMSADMTHLGNYAFYKCTALTSATFADGSQLTSIGKHAFDNCSALTSIEIPSSVTSLGGVYPDGEVFYKCSALTSVNIPDGITFIGDNTFYNCYSLSSVSIPNSVTQIGHHAFANCTTLVSFTIPAQVQYITNNMFNGCSGLETVTFAEGSELISLGNYAFYNCTKLSDLYVPWMANPLPTVSSASVFFGSTLANVNLHLPFAAWSNYETATTWKNFKQVPVVTAKADPENDGVYYNTFYHGTVTYALPTGVEAYTAQRDGTDLILTKIAQAGDVLPAGTAVILKSSVQQFEMTPSEETPVTVGENDLLGKDASEMAPANCYVLSGPNPSNPDITEVGFYQFTGTLGAHKAYLVIPGSNPAPPRHLRFVFDSTQDIEQPTSDSSLKGGEKILLDGVLYIQRGEHLYNAQGVRVK